MRILFATDCYLPTPGGISVVVERLSSTLAAKGHTVAVIAPSVSWNFGKEQNPNLTIYRINSILIHKSKNLQYSPAFLFRQKIYHIINNFRPDIVHLETPQNIAEETLKAARNLKIPVIATCHIMPENISGALTFLPSKIRKMVGNIYMKQIIKIFDKTDLVTSPTPIGVALLQANGLKVPAIPLSNGIDLHKFRQPSQEIINNLIKKYKIPDYPIILYIGRLDKEKKVEILIKSLTLISKSLPFHVIIEGKGQLCTYLKDLTQKLDIENRVTFIDYVYENELAPLYALSTVFVMPSTAELQSLVTMEAMALGLPVIGAEAGALPYLIKPGINGYLFKPDDPSDLAREIELILKDPQLRKKMSAQSLSLIKEHDINIIIQKMEIIYTKLINKKSLTLHPSPSSL